MATKKTWEQQILQKIEEQRKVTYLGAAHPELSPEEHPNFKVFEYTPNKSLDGDKRYYLAGPEWSIMQQSSMIKANHDILGQRLGFTLDFEEWFTYFEYEFLNAIPPRNRPPKAQWKPWGKDVKHRPKKKNLMDKKEAGRKGFMVIEFWPDRTVENDSKRLLGTPTQLMMLLMNEMKTVKTEVQVYGMPTIAYQETHRFVPQILLYFMEDLEDVDSNFAPVDGTIKARVIGETYETINETKAKALANKIKAEFAASNGYVWRKGKVICSYTDNEAGLKTWGPFRDKVDAQNLYTKVLSIQNKTFNPAKMNFKENANASEAYPTIPPTKQIYGESRKLPRSFPVADVRFVRAELHIWGRPKPVILIDRSGVSKQPLVTAN
ncbi:MAG: hypothetical protein VKK42_07795 [Lyngbya sp.]|nr:hypothetical protein [Lyngbya sp.]